MSRLFQVSIQIVKFHSAEPSMRMNVTISKDFIRETIGHDFLSNLLLIIRMNDSILNYVIPWMGTIVYVTNLIVMFFCIVIYLKTKRKNHKPAFVFIGFLAAIDSILGGYVYF